MGVLAAINWGLLARGGANSGDLVVAALGWLLMTLLFAQNPPRADGSGRVAGFFGLILPGVVSLQTFRVPGTDLWFLKIVAFVLLGGVLLLSCGWGGLVSRWRLTAILFVMLVPENSLGGLLNHGGALVLAHARVAGFLLHCAGFDVAIHGPLLTLPTGSVEVEEACSGLILMLLLLKIALIVSIAFPIRLPLRFMTCAAALVTGFAVGVMRVTVLAVVVHKRDLFDQLHGVVGMSLFPLIGFLIYAPFLLPMERPFVELLQIVRLKWRSASQTQCRGIRYPLTVVAGAALLLCLLKDDWIEPSSSQLRPETFGALGLPCRLNEPYPVPADLRASRFNAVRDAWRCEFRRNGEAWTGLVCQVSGALLAPEDILANPRVARFLNGQFGGSILIPSGLAVQRRWDAPSNINREDLAVARVPGGMVGVTAINADGDEFFTVLDYNTAQRATFFRLSTWKDALLTGRPLKDLRYWMIVVFLEKKN